MSEQADRLKGMLLRRACAVFPAMKEPPRHTVWGHLRDWWRLSRMLRPMHCHGCIYEHMESVKRWHLWETGSTMYVGRRYLPYGSQEPSEKSRDNYV
jgi:hypothetical protein